MIARPHLLGFVGGALLAGAGLLAADQWLEARPPPHRVATFERFPDVELTTHEGKTVRFYEDLVKGKIVAINFFYVACESF